MAERKPTLPAWISTAVMLFDSRLMLLMLFAALALSSCVWENTGGVPSPTAVVAEAASPTPVPRPDLAIEEIVLEADAPPDGVCNTPEDVFVLRVTLINRGAAEAGAFVFEINTVPQSVPSGLAPGETITLSFPHGQATVEARIDSTDQVVETDENNNTLTRELATPELPAICFSTPTPEVRLFAPLLTLEGHTDRVLAVAFSPDGRLVASGSVDNTMRLWTADQGDPLRVMQGHNFPILSLKFTPDGTRLVTGSMDGILRVWQVSNSALLSTMRGHAGWITSLDISPDNQLVVTGSDDFTVRIWRLASSSLLQTVDEGMAAIDAVAFSPDSLAVAWAEADGTVRVRGVRGGTLLSFKGTGQQATSLAFSPDGAWLAAGYDNGSIYIWQMSDGGLKQVIPTEAEGVTALAVSPDGSRLASASIDGNISLWLAGEEGFSTNPAAVLAGHDGQINAMDFSPRANLLVSAGNDGTVRLWELPADTP